MYLRNSRIVLNDIGCGQTRQSVLAIHVNPSGPPPLPPVITQTPENAHMPFTHTRTHAHKFIKCPTHNIPETIFKLLSVNKHKPQLTAVTELMQMYKSIFSSPWMPPCAIFMSFVYDTNYVYKCNPNINPIFPQRFRVGIICFE